MYIFMTIPRHYAPENFPPQHLRLFLARLFQTMDYASESYYQQPDRTYLNMEFYHQTPQAHFPYALTYEAPQPGPSNPTPAIPEYQYPISTTQSYEFVEHTGHRPSQSSLSDATEQLQPGTPRTQSPTSRKRDSPNRRAKAACLHCRKRRSKCNELTPCSECQRSKTHCEYKLPRPPKNSNNIAAVQSQVESLRTTVEELKSMFEARLPKAQAQGRYTRRIRQECLHELAKEGYVDVVCEGDRSMVLISDMARMEQISKGIEVALQNRD